MAIDLSGLDLEGDQVFDPQAVRDEMDSQLSGSLNDLPLPGEGNDITVDSAGSKNVDFDVKGDLLGTPIKDIDGFPADFGSLTKSVITTAGDVAKTGIQQAGKPGAGSTSSGSTSGSMPKSTAAGSGTAPQPARPNWSAQIAPKSGSGLSTGAKVGIAVGALAVGGTLIGMVAWAATRPRRRVLPGVR